MKNNQILIEKHLSSVTGHSTMLATVLIDFHAANALEYDDKAVILSTNLSTAFNTVNYGILIRKL